MTRPTPFGLTLALALGLALPAVAQTEASRGLAGAYLAARQAGLHNDYREAARHYARALARDPRNPSLLENTLLSQVGLGDVARAVPVARRMETAGIDSQVANMILIADMIAAGDYTRVLDDIAAGRSVGPLVDGLVTAWARLGAGEADAALADFDTAAEATGLQAFALYHKGLALALLGDYGAAHEVFDAEGEGPLQRTQRGITARAEILSQLGRNGEAVALIDDAFGTRSDPALTELRVRLEAGERVPFTVVGSVVDGAAEVFYSVAGALRGEANDAYTLLYSRVAEYLSADNVQAILLSADLLNAQERHELAVETYARVPADDPAFYVAEMGRAASLQASERDDDAIAVLQALSESHPDLPIVHTTLGDMLRRAERFAEAIPAYDRAVALLGAPEPEHWVVYFTRGICHEREDQWDAAEADFRLALELNPGQPQVLNYLGYSYVEMQINLDEALAMIEEAAAARPDSGHIVDSLGWVLYRLGRYEEAVGYMEKASELLPVDPIINDHLGDVYWAVGRRTEARFQWHRALSFDPEPEDAERIRRKLDVGLDKVLEEEGAPPLEMAGDDG